MQSIFKNDISEFFSMWSFTIYFWYCIYFLSSLYKETLGIDLICLSKNYFNSLIYKFLNYFYAIAFLCIFFIAFRHVNSPSLFHPPPAPGNHHALWIWVI